LYIKPAALLLIPFLLHLISSYVSRLCATLYERPLTERVSYGVPTNYSVTAYKNDPCLQVKEGRGSGHTNGWQYPEEWEILLSTYKNTCDLGNFGVMDKSGR